MPQISIIIPCYNVEGRIINRCLNSILDQPYQDYEVLLVDDGSSKEAGEMLEKCISMDARIKLYHQENGGASSARNSGISYSTGEYIAFVDADDTITGRYLTEAIYIAQKENADIVYGFIYRGTKELSERPVIEESPEYEEVSNEWLRERHFRTFQPDGNKSFGRGPCARLLRRELATAIHFPEGIPIGEDVIWNLEILEQAKKKILVDSIWYNYIIYDESVTRKYSPDIQEKLKPFYNAISKYVKNTPEDKALYLSRIAYDFTNYILRLYVGAKNNRETFIGKWKKAYCMGKSEPWRNLVHVYTDKEVYKKLDNPTKVKAQLMRFNLLWPVWSIEQYRKKRHYE